MTDTKRPSSQVVEMANCLLFAVSKLHTCKKTAKKLSTEYELEKHFSFARRILKSAASRSKASQVPTQHKVEPLALIAKRFSELAISQTADQQKALLRYLSSFPPDVLMQSARIYGQAISAMKEKRYQAQMFMDQICDAGLTIEGGKLVSLSLKRQ